MFVCRLYLPFPASATMLTYDSWCTPSLCQKPSWQNWSLINSSPLSFKTIPHPSLQIKAVYCRDSILPLAVAGWIYGFEIRGRGKRQTVRRPYRCSPGVYM